MGNQGRPRKEAVSPRPLWRIIEKDVRKYISKDWPAFIRVPEDELCSLLYVAEVPGLIRDNRDSLMAFCRHFENNTDFTLAVITKMRSLISPDRVKGRQKMRLFFATQPGIHGAYGEWLDVNEASDQDLAAAISRAPEWSAKGIDAETIRKARREFRTN